jgi:hypothetical protein
MSGMKFDRNRKFFNKTGPWCTAVKISLLFAKKKKRGENCLKVQSRIDYYADTGPSTEMLVNQMSALTNMVMSSQQKLAQQQNLVRQMANQQNMLNMNSGMSGGGSMSGGMGGGGRGFSEMDNINDVRNRRDSFERGADRMGGSRMGLIGTQRSQSRRDDFDSHSRGGSSNRRNNNTPGIKLFFTCSANILVFHVVLYTFECAKV